MKENIKKIIIILEIISLVIIIAGCSSNTKENNIDEKTDDNYLNEQNAKALKISNTCPINQKCTSPSCGLWSDINKDGFCDRGTQ